jgi:hypothetical protein
MTAGQVTVSSRSSTSGFPFVTSSGSVSSLTDGADSSADVESGTQPSFVVDSTQLTTATAAEFTGGGMGGGGMGGGPRGGFGG